MTVHLAYPHEAGFMSNCPACEERCRCTPRTSLCSHCAAVDEKHYPKSALLKIEGVWHIYLSPGECRPVLPTSSPIGEAL